MPEQQLIATTALLLAAGCLGGSLLHPAHAMSSPRWDQAQDHPVKGTGVHRFSEAIEHSRNPTGTGEVVRSTDIIDLEGDLHGQVLYHPRTRLNFQRFKLVNTGHQVFSGTILGSDPVLLYDNAFRFNVDLATGATRGRVFLDQTIAGPKARCELEIDGTGVIRPNGDAEFVYAGVCRIRLKNERTEDLQ